MCASRRVARSAAQPSTGKTRKASEMLVLGRKTTSITAISSSRWTVSSTRATGRAAARARDEQRQHGQLGGQGRQERHQHRQPEVARAEAVDHGQGGEPGAQQCRHRRAEVVADAVHLVEERGERVAPG